MFWLFAAHLKWHNPKHEKVDLLIIWSLYGVAPSSASDEANIDQAIKSLNSRVTVHPDKKLVLTAVSQQTRVPEKTLRSQMNATHLGYGELLIANSLVEGSGKNLNEVLAMKKGKGWASLSIETPHRPEQHRESTSQRRKDGADSSGKRTSFRGSRGIANTATSSAGNSPTLFDIWFVAECSSLDV